jgi:hypothetical protein
MAPYEFVNFLFSCKICFRKQMTYAPNKRDNSKNSQTLREQPTGADRYAAHGMANVEVYLELLPTQWATYIVPVRLILL